jgi:two-component system heavy metal sensor histidine kinase CusS
MDAAKMERAVANLISNAVKYTSLGYVRVFVADKGNRLQLRVEDTGPGIPPDALKHLFSKFFRVRDGREKMEGTGLGLAVVKGIVEAHGGAVSSDSAPGRGAVFTLELPKP